MKNVSQKIAIIAGARPNFMKVAPLVHALQKQNMGNFLVNTGQHFSKAMADDFLQEFQIQSQYTLKPSRSSAEKQMQDIMDGLQKIFLKEKPSMVVVVGDVNSTLAGALIAKNMHIPCAHVEAGLRSYNLAMPEEQNRMVVDQLADYLFTTEKDGAHNLAQEGIREHVFYVGNIMIDTLKLFEKKVVQIPKEKKYYFCTLHRAENVDSKKIFLGIVRALEKISQDAPIYLPLHPRTKKMAQQFGLLKKLQNACHIIPLLSYTESVSYQKYATVILTDSGGIQEESSVLGVPCLTLRTETERPITVKKGTNTIAGVSTQSILSAYKKKSLKKKKVHIPLWDGKAAQRIVSVIKKAI